MLDTLSVAAYVAPLMHRLRQSLLVALTLVMSVFAVAPHQHEGFVEDLFRDGVEQIGKCQQPNTRHFHRAKAVHGDACVACARQHATGTFRGVVRLATPRVAIRFAVASFVRVASASIVVPRLRGPPA